MLKQRQPYVGQTLDVPSPLDAEIVFTIRRVDNRAVIAYRDRNSVVRYIQRDGDGEFLTEKDYPMGSMRLDTLVLGLVAWNIAGPDGQMVLLTPESIKDYLDPVEFDVIYDKIIEINPILLGRDQQKKDSAAS